MINIWYLGISQTMVMVWKHKHQIFQLRSLKDLENNILLQTLWRVTQYHVHLPPHEWPGREGARCEIKKSGLYFPVQDIQSPTSAGPGFEVQNDNPNSNLESSAMEFPLKLYFFLTTVVHRMEKRVLVHVGLSEAKRRFPNRERLVLRLNGTSSVLQTR